MNRYEKWRRLSQCFTLRMKVFLGILIATALLTIFRPTFLIEWFEASPVEMLSRIWIIASLATTIIITFFANMEIVAEGASARMHADDWGRRIGQVSGLNSLILIYCLIVILAAAIPATPLLAIYLLSGTGLVMLIMRFDWHLLGIAEIRLSELESRNTNSSTPELGTTKDPDSHNAERDDHQTELDKAKETYQTAEQTFFNLDIPLLAGVFIAFVIGQLLLPHVLLPEDATAAMVTIYADGFASGATAIQIVVANVAYGIITVLAGK